MNDIAVGIILAIAAAAIYGFLGLSFELAAKRDYPNWDFMLYKQSCGTLIGLTFTIFLGLPWYRPRILLLALIGAISYLVTLWAYLEASRERDIAANWTILNLSVALPVLFSVFWFHDRFTVSKAIGILLTLGAIVLIGGLGGVRREFTRRWTQCITVAFLLNGWFVVILRFVPEELGALFTSYFYGLSSLLVILYKLAVRERLSRPRGIYGVAAMGAVTHWSGIMLTIIALSVVARVSAQAGLIVYPITNGLPIVTGVLLGWLVLKQKVNFRSAIGIASGAAALVFLSWG